MAGFPFPCGQFFQIHRSKLKLHPVCYLGQASVLRVTHPVLFLCVGKHTLDLLFSLRYSSLYCPMCRTSSACSTYSCQIWRMTVFSHLHFCAHCSGWAVLAQIRPALVLPVSIPICRGIMQRTIFRADHIIIVFVVHIRPPGMAVLFRSRTGITCGKNSAAFEDPLADPWCFVGAVRHYGLVFRVVLAQFIVQRIKRYAVMDIPRVT